MISIELTRTFAEAILVAVEAEEHVEGRRLKITIIVYWCRFVLTIDEHAWRELHILISSIPVQELCVDWEAGVEVGEVYFPERVALVDAKLLPFGGELLAAAAVRIDKRDDPRVFVIRQNLLFK